MRLLPATTAAAIILLGSFALSAPANASNVANTSARTISATTEGTAEPSPNPAGGVLTVCAGNDLNLNDANGVPYSLEDQQAYIDNVWYGSCAPSQQPMAANAKDKLTAKPNILPDPPRTYGYAQAELHITPGLMVWYATMYGWPKTYNKTVSCTWKMGENTSGGLGKVDWTGCGTFGPTKESSGSTRENSVCPPKGKLVEVSSQVTFKGTYITDTATGVTK